MKNLPDIFHEKKFLLLVVKITQLFFKNQQYSKK